MITDIPTPHDFRDAGIAYLNLAWESATELALHARDLELHDWDSEGKLTEGYWIAAQRTLGKSVSLALQGAEFLLKGKIASVSPYLLIVQSVGEWPRGSAQKDIPFADFKTVDAQDLCRLHDTVTAPRLNDEFKELFLKLRRLRNTVTHTVDPNLKFAVKDIIVDVLILSEHLVGKQAWIANRHDYRDKNPGGVISIYDDIRHCIQQREFSIVVDWLTPGQTDRFFGFDKKQRRYSCPDCSSICADEGLLLDTALLIPNTKSSTTLHCVICKKTFVVERVDCLDKDCKGNVMYEGDCMTCPLNIV